jgi:lipopolysaccharide heptosyltransferase II
MPELFKDKAALARRNRLMAQAFHQSSTREQMRRNVLQMVALLPPLPNQLYTPRTKERLLLIRPDHIGDVLLTTPAIRALRATRPHAELHALVGTWAAPILEPYRELDALITLEFPGFTRTPNTDWTHAYRLALVTARRLRLLTYSAAVVFRPDHWWGAMVAKLAGIPLRIGYATTDTAQFLSHQLPPYEAHAVLQNLRLVERWTGELTRAQIDYRYPVLDEHRDFIAHYLAGAAVAPSQSLVVIHVGSGARVKNWLPEKWASVADTLTEQLDAQVILVGSGAEAADARAIAERMRLPAVIAAGETTLPQLAALLERAGVVLGADSGPMHLAAAVGAPTVALYGPADPNEFGTWGSAVGGAPPSEKHFSLTSSIPCRPCRVLDWGFDSLENHPCVRDIQVGAVLDAARRAWAMRRKL